MTKFIKIFSFAVVALLALLSMARSAFGYIDPGTTQVIWTTLAPVIGVLVACFAVAIWPIRFAWRMVSGRWAKWHPAGKVLSLLALVAILAGAGYGIVRMLTTEELTAPVISGPLPDADYKGVIVLGIDGLDPTVLSKMMDEGKVPNFAKLRSEGTFAPLQTTTPAASPVAWTSAATGVNPGRHGIFDFFARDPKNYQIYSSMTRIKEGKIPTFPLRPYKPATSRAAFWHILSTYGVNTSVIHWPVTFPPLPVTGHLLSGLGTPDVGGTIGLFSFYTTDLELAREAEHSDLGNYLFFVSWNQDTVKAELYGPPVFTVRGSHPSKADLHVKRSADGQSAIIQLGEAKPISLKPGEWSDLIRFNFSGGVSSSCPSNVRVYLAELTPHLKLYIGGRQIDPDDPAFPITYPESFAGELVENIGTFHTLGLPEEHLGVMNGVLPLSAFLENCNDITAEREHMLNYELERFKGGVLAIVFDTNDRISHFLWPVNDPSHPYHKYFIEKGFGQEVENHYIWMDKILGKVLAAADEDVAVIVMSDHGFASANTIVRVDRWLAANGFLARDESQSFSDGRHGIKAPEDLSKSKAYARGYNGIYLNVIGRESKGIVQPGEEYFNVREEIMRKLKTWKHPETGELLVRNVYTREEIYQGEFLDEAPDIVIGFYPGILPMPSAGAPVSKTMIVEDLTVEEITNTPWCGDHMFDAPCMPGVFLSNIKVDGANPRLVDICPTILRCFNAPPPPDLDGKAIF